MPAKKTTKSKSKFDIQRMMDNPDSYKNLVYGVITVVVLFAVLFLGLRTLSNNRPDVTDEAVDTREQQNANVHVVEAGESLWSIAEEEYGDGFKWEAIAKANNIDNASNLEEGTRLTIPDAEATDETAMVSPTVATDEAEQNVSPTVSPTEAPKPTTVTPTTEVRPTEAVPAERRISGGKYKVVEGDYLWDIAVRAYGDGYRWVEIARENNIANPDLIYPDTELNLKRP